MTRNYLYNTHIAPAIFQVVKRARVKSANGSIAAAAAFRAAAKTARAYDVAYYITDGGDLYSDHYNLLATFCYEHSFKCHSAARNSR